ncbi:hypothetical protein FNV43_RR25096 [Rhamnella rubrinervis]|uniref:LRAT domain-containing protein n=1 Tax=Rhamnella rubrinervis TaxID=2594499 RepID=A0A8K0GRB4_9ROSA|nr:hypothetical protein FNV43_RR25096 [Rhamnella rubrinervis]
MGVLSSRIQRKQLRIGDHIYTWRRAYIYAHHGIYAGYHYPVCGDQPRLRLSGVITSWLDCFLSCGDLYRFEYGVNIAEFLAET